jgi:hypothetical protein
MEKLFFLSPLGCKENVTEAPMIAADMVLVVQMVSVHVI